jgi:hypothetical protein
VKRTAALSELHKVNYRNALILFAPRDGVLALKISKRSDVNPPL